MNAIKKDTDTVKREFDAISTPTQVFISCLVGLGLLAGLVVGGAVGFGISVEDIEGSSCIVYDDTAYCENPELTQQLDNE